MDAHKQDEIRQAVRSKYGQAVTHCGDGIGSTACCCGSSSGLTHISSERLGYSRAELENVPAKADLGLGCGNPHAFAALRPGEVVLDLGSGAGIDCFIAAGQVGETGHVIGVDMTPEMISKARANAVQNGYKNVEFRLGEIENLPVANNTVDVVVSNCVVNLSPDKPRVYAELLRVLKPGGRLAISDVIATRPIPENMKSDMSLYSC